MSLWRADVTQLLAMYADGTATPTQALETTLARISALDPTLNAYTTLNQAAQAQAAAATARWSRSAPLGPLDGVPLIIKDNLAVAGMPTSWGNAHLAKLMCADDETPLARLRAAGAIFLGKGNTPEFAVEGYTDNLTFGTTRNPYDHELTPGGSSGGVVTAVAAGMAFAGIGTDGGGSIRRPVGYTGLWGLKPGIGDIPRGGGLPQVLLDFEVVGPITRSARDLALIRAVMARHPGQSPKAQKHTILAVETLNDAPCDPLIKTAFAQACERLRALGHCVITADLPIDLEPLNTVWTQIGAVGLAAFFAQHPEVRRSATPKYVQMADTGAALSAPEFYQIVEHVLNLRDACKTLFHTHDFILTPTAAANPWPAADPYPSHIDGTAVGPRGHAVFTGWVNAAGLPAVAYPAATDGIPIGMQLIGATGDEAPLIALAHSCSDPFKWPTLGEIPS